MDALKHAREGSWWGEIRSLLSKPMVLCPRDSAGLSFLETGGRKQMPAWMLPQHLKSELIVTTATSLEGLGVLMVLRPIYCEQALTPP